MNKGIFKFTIFSIIGVVFFLVPLPINGKTKIMISHITEFIKTNVLDQFLLFTQIVAGLVAILTLIFVFYTSKNKYLNELFKCNLVNVIARISGSLLYIVVLNQLFNNISFFEAINSGGVGQVMAGPDGLLTVLYITFFVGIFMLPLLTHFGSVEFIGTLIAPFVRKVFKVPGYAAIDAIASFVGDGTIGIIVTDQQYQRGYYTRREAYIIATSFSIVGIAFASAVAEELGFSEIFPIFYGSIALITVIIAIITARLPLKKYEDKYYEGVEPKLNELEYENGIFSHSLKKAATQANKNDFRKIINESLTHILNVYIGFLPVIMLVGTTGLLLAEYTSVFQIIATPLEYVYGLLGFDDTQAQLMAPASIVGLADMYLPALFIAESSSSVAKFIIGVLAFTQLVFMSETGMVLVKSKIGLNILDVVKVFLYRTVISVPLVFLIALLLNTLNII